MDGGWNDWREPSAPPGPSGDQVANEGECKYINRGWEVTPAGVVPSWPSGDRRTITRTIDENSPKFVISRNEFEGPGCVSRATRRST
jgi:hypothetical protein